MAKTLLDVKTLKAIAKELNEVMQLEPKDRIKTVAVKAEKLQAEIIEVAGADLDPEKDLLTDQLILNLEALGLDMGAFKDPEVITPTEEEATEEEATEDTKTEIELPDNETELPDTQEQDESKEIVIGEALTKPDKAQGMKVAKDLCDSLGYDKKHYEMISKLSFQKALKEIADLAGFINAPYQEGEETIYPNDTKDSFKKLTVSWLEKAGIPVQWESQDPGIESAEDAVAKNSKKKKTELKIVKKDTKKKAPKQKGATLMAVEKMIEVGKNTKKEICESVAIELGVKPITVGTMITDGKNPKYNKFKSLVKIDGKGVVSF